MQIVTDGVHIQLHNIFFELGMESGSYVELCDSKKKKLHHSEEL